MAETQRSDGVCSACEARGSKRQQPGTQTRASERRLGANSTRNVSRKPWEVSARRSPRCCGRSRAARAPTDSTRGHTRTPHTQAPPRPSGSSFEAFSGSHAGATAPLWREGPHPRPLSAAAPQPRRVARFPRREPCGQQQGLRPAGDSRSVYQHVGAHRRQRGQTRLTVSRFLEAFLQFYF